jgi:hypothetical protein
MELVDKTEVSPTNGELKKQTLITEISMMLDSLDLPRIESVKTAASIEVSFQSLQRSQAAMTENLKAIAAEIARI